MFYGWLARIRSNLNLRNKYLLDSVVHNISDNGHAPGLAQSQSPTNGLLFHRRIPLWLEEMNAIRSG